jgi:hypothetical protein
MLYCFDPGIGSRESGIVEAVPVFGQCLAGAPTPGTIPHSRFSTAERLVFSIPGF